nr:MAG TPA_asm: hypothetical protein [Caudoviricetes sp.]
MPVHFAQSRMTFVEGSNMVALGEQIIVNFI